MKTIIPKRIKTHNILNRKEPIKLKITSRGTTSVEEFKLGE